MDPILTFQIILSLSLSLSLLLSFSRSFLSFFSISLVIPFLYPYPSISLFLLFFLSFADLSFPSSLETPIDTHEGSNVSFVLKRWWEEIWLVSERKMGEKERRKWGREGNKNEGERETERDWWNNESDRVTRSHIDLLFFVWKRKCNFFRFNFPSWSVSLEFAFEKKGMEKEEGERKIGRERERERGREDWIERFSVNGLNWLKKNIFSLLFLLQHREGGGKRERERDGDEENPTHWKDGWPRINRDSWLRSSLFFPSSFSFFSSFFPPSPFLFLSLPSTHRFCCIWLPWTFVKWSGSRIRDF